MNDSSTAEKYQYGYANGSLWLKGTGFLLCLRTAGHGNSRLELANLDGADMPSRFSAALALACEPRSHLNLMDRLKKVLLTCVETDTQRLILALSWMSNAFERQCHTMSLKDNASRRLA